MADRNRLALRNANRRVLAASFLVFGLFGALAAFAVGYAGAVRQAAADPQAAANVRIAALERLDASLGYEGYLRAYRAYFETGDARAADDLKRLANQADDTLSTLRRASGVDAARFGATDFERRLAPFRRAALFAGSAQAGANPSETAMERDYAALKGEIAKTMEVASAERLRTLSEALVWSQAASVATLSLLSIVLFALAWFMRENLIDPLEALRRSVAGAARGNIALPIWGVERKDEIGAVARAAEMMRQATVAAAKPADPQPLNRMIERLNRGIVRLEAELAQMATIAGHARLRIEDAGLRAAKASHAAAQAANLACEGTARMTQRSQTGLRDANVYTKAILTSVAETLERLAHAAAALDRTIASVPQTAAPQAPAESAADEARTYEAAEVLDDLVENLEALEYFVQSRKDLGGEEAANINAALIGAIDRLNAVAGHVRPGHLAAN